MLKIREHTINIFQNTVSKDRKKDRKFNLSLAEVEELVCQ